MKKAFINALGAGGLAILSAGCSQTGKLATGECIEGSIMSSPLASFGSTSFNQSCAKQRAARDMLNPKNLPSVQTLGMTILRQEDPDIDRAAREVNAGRGAPPPKSVPCKGVITGINKDTGEISANCRAKASALTM